MSDNTVPPEEPETFEQSDSPGSFARRTGPQFHLRPQWWNWTGIKTLLDDRIQKQSPEAVPKSGLKGLRYFWIDGVFASISENILLSFLAVFVLAYGATNGQIGLMTAIGNLFGMIALFPGAAHAERTLNPKGLVLWSGGGIGRAAILLLVAVPFVAPTAQIAIWASLLYPDRLSALTASRSCTGMRCSPPRATARQPRSQAILRPAWSKGTRKRATAGIKKRAMTRGR